LFSRYEAFRDSLCRHIFEDISRTQPDLTRHGISHIQAVMKNALDLLGEDVHELSPMELYCLSLSILFHDVGNIKERKGHQQCIPEIYNEVIGSLSADAQERRLISAIGAAHCGVTSNGSKDTLGALSVDAEPLFRGPVRQQIMAAILRFADELDEGPERTSVYLLKEDKFSDESWVYHEYARSTHVLVDRPGARIVLTYNINIPAINAGRLAPKDKKRLRKLLSKVGERIIKLDEERQYAKHYCDYLKNFKLTSVAFNFCLDGDGIDLDVPKLNIPDTVLTPGKSPKDIASHGTEYAPDDLIVRIEKILAERTNKKATIKSKSDGLLGAIRNIFKKG